MKQEKKKFDPEFYIVHEMDRVSRRYLVSGIFCTLFSVFMFLAILNQDGIGILFWVSFILLLTLGVIGLVVGIGGYVFQYWYLKNKLNQRRSL